MAGALETKACEACATAKRKCGKQTPHCVRCTRRGIECTYPRSKPSSFVLCDGEDIFPNDHEIVLPYSTSLFSYSPAFQPERTRDARPCLGLDLPEFSIGPFEHQLASSWFENLETWNIYRFPKAERNTYSILDLNRHLAKIHRWLTEWVEKGSNPFIHSRLYRTRFPRWVQDAYTTLTCYIQKTESNEQIVFQIIEDRATQLLAEHGILLRNLSPENVNPSSSALDPLEHLARVQALLIYQVIGLYDGNIRLRHLAESYTAVLNRWMRLMVQQASQAACLGFSIISSTHDQTAIGFSFTDVAHSESQLWYSWILAESIRRTWLVTSGIHGIYVAIQKGGVAGACLGGMMFTTRQGIWEAQSAPSWEKLCSEVNVGLMHLNETDRLFTETAPEDIDEFSRVTLEVVFGVDKLQRWVSQYKTGR